MSTESRNYIGLMELNHVSFICLMTMKIHRRTERLGQGVGINIVFLS